MFYFQPLSNIKTIVNLLLKYLLNIVPIHQSTNVLIVSALKIDVWLLQYLHHNMFLITVFLLCS